MRDVLNHVMESQGGANSQLLWIGSVASIVLGMLLIIIGFYLKKKKKEWWFFSIGLGIAAIFSNFMQLL